MPLDGMTVLDATQVMAGPFCTLLLADMGAEVIKVEKPDGDDSRRIGPPFINGESAAYLGINRNKQSVVLDLRTDAGKDAFHRLAAQVDVVAENRDKFLALATTMRKEPVGSGAGHQALGHLPQGNGGPDLSGGPFLGDAPATWQQKAQSPRQLHHTFGTDGEVYVSQLSGDIGPMLGIWLAE